MKKQRPPQPYVQAFVVCREIFEDHHTGEYLLFAPRSAFRLPEFPASIKFAVYAHLTELHGKYRLELRLEDSEGEILWAVRADPPVKHEDPLMPHRFAFRDLKRSRHSARPVRLAAGFRRNRDRPACSLVDGRGTERTGSLPGVSA